MPLTSWHPAQGNVYVYKGGTKGGKFRALEQSRVSSESPSSKVSFTKTHEFMDGMKENNFFPLFALQANDDFLLAILPS